MDVSYRPFVMEDFIEVLDARKVREIEKEELEASSDRHWKEVLCSSLSTSDHLWVIISNGKIEGVFGLVVCDDVVVPWFIGSVRLNTFSYRFAKESRNVIKMWKEMYPDKEFRNYVYSKHFEAKRWLKWLGFTISDEYVYRKNKDVPFQIFHMNRR